MENCKDLLSLLGCLVAGSAGVAMVVGRGKLLKFGCAVFVLALAALAIALPAHALTIRSATVVQHSGETHFRVTLSDVPDLVSVDQYGRNKDQIGVWVTHDLSIDPFSVPDLIFRSGDSLGVFVALHDGSNDAIAELPYDLAGRRVSFAAPDTLIGSGPLRWHLLVFEYGLDVDQRSGSVGDPVNAPLATATQRSSWGRVKALYAGR